MSNGVIRNFTILTVLWVLYYITPEDFGVPMGLIIGGFTVTNIISMFENLTRMGVEIPFNISEHLRMLKETLNPKNK